jgi:hypothetical protein
VPELFPDDDAARHALHTLNDEPAPPVATSLDQVLRRGRRRVFIQRASAVAGAVVVVAAIGVTTVLLRSSTEPSGGDRVQVAATTPPKPKPAGPLPGWETIPIDEATCKQNPLQNVPGKPPETLLPRNVVETVFTSAIVDVVGPKMIPLDTIWEEYSPKAEGPRGYVVAEIPMDNGNGQLQLEAQVYPGTPTQMADASLYSYGDCKAPARRTLDDGTVMQLYQPDFVHPEQPMQHLQIYRPDGREYIVTAAGWGEQDYVQAGDGQGGFIEGGRGKLPATEAQLAKLAEYMVPKLG